LGVRIAREKGKYEIQGSFALLRMTTGTGDGRFVEGYGAERYGGYWLVEFFGVPLLCSGSESQPERRRREPANENDFLTSAAFVNLPA